LTTGVVIASVTMPRPNLSAALTQNQKSITSLLPLFFFLLMFKNFNYISKLLMF